MGASVLAITLVPPLVRLSGSARTGSVLVVLFAVLLLGARLVRRVGPRSRFLTVRSALAVWGAPVVGVVGGFFAALALTSHGHAPLAVVLAVLVAAGTVAVMASCYGASRGRAGDTRGPA